MRLSCHFLQHSKDGNAILGADDCADQIEKNSRWNWSDKAFFECNAVSQPVGRAFLANEAGASEASSGGRGGASPRLQQTDKPAAVCRIEARRYEAIHGSHRGVPAPPRSSGQQMSSRLWAAFSLCSSHSQFLFMAPLRHTGRL